MEESRDDGRWALLTPQPGGASATQRQSAIRHCHWARLSVGGGGCLAVAQQIRMR